MSDFYEGQAVIVKYNGKHGVVTRVSGENTVVVQVGDRTLYLKPQDLRAQ